MLGWEFLVSRQRGDGDEDGTGAAPVLARWQAGLGGTKWLDDLVSKGVASDLGGDGYPIRYTVPAGILVAVLGEGPPKHGGPVVIGDDYILPGGWTGNVRIDIARMKELDPSEILLVEAWDQS